MHRFTARIVRPALGIAILGVLTGAAVVSAPASPALAVEGAGQCEVATSELSWGVRESFRSYISGSIANGGWETSNGAGYETPNFLWNNGAGSVGSALDSGSITFTGGVHFSGHEGALKFELANPVIEFAPDNAAYLLLDMASTDTGTSTDTPALAQVRVAKLDLENRVSAEGQELSLQSVPVRLTSEGAAAFNGSYGSYAAGDELDPISMQASVTGCELGGMHIMETPGDTAEEPESGELEVMPISAPQTVQVPWVPIIIAGVALVAIGVTTGLLLAGRRRGELEHTEGDESAERAEGAESSAASETTEGTEAPKEKPDSRD